MRFQILTDVFDLQNCRYGGTGEGVIALNPPAIGNSLLSMLTQKKAHRLVFLAVLLPFDPTPPTLFLFLF